MGEWLGDTPIFKNTMTERERNEFALFKAKENAMTVNNTAKNAINEQKENTMSIKGIPMGTRKNGTLFYDRAEDLKRHTDIREKAKFGRAKGIEVTTCIPGETWKNFTDDEHEVELLGKACKKFGWKNGVCTVAKAAKYHGTPNPEYDGHGWLVQYKPYVYKTGERAGQAKEPTKTIVYPMEAFVWDTESGLPEFDNEKKAASDAKKAARKARAAAKALKQANAAAGIKTPRHNNRQTNHEPKVVAAPSLIHIKLPNGVEFDAHDAKEAAELKALFA